jgi:hypothetical protein
LTRGAPTSTPRQKIPPPFTTVPIWGNLSYNFWVPPIRSVSEHHVWVKGFCVWTNQISFFFGFSSVANLATTSVPSDNSNNKKGIIIIIIRTRTLSEQQYQLLPPIPLHPFLVQSPCCNLLHLLCFCQPATCPSYFFNFLSISSASCCIHSFIVLCLLEGPFNSSDIQLRNPTRQFYTGAPRGGLAHSCFPVHLGCMHAQWTQSM